MELINRFHIGVTTKHKGSFRMEVEHFYSTEQVERFRVNGAGNKFLLMEKRMANIQQPWKIIEASFSSGTYKEVAYAILEIQKAIDRYLVVANGGEIKPWYYNPRAEAKN